MSVSLVPFERQELDILFVGLNPADGSNTNGHYFSVRPSLWEQLALSGLITKPLHHDDSWRTADALVFGCTEINYRGWSYGVTDLLPQVVNSDSTAVTPLRHHGEDLILRISQLNPRMAIILHSKVSKCIERVANVSLSGFSESLPGYGITSATFGNSRTIIARVPFPHGSKFSYAQISSVYRELKEELEVRS